jgi:hypothetical protein
MANYVFPSDLTSRQQGHFMKIQIEPSKIGSAPPEKNTVFLFIPGGQQNGPLQWQMVHEYDDVKLTKLGAGVVGGITRLLPGGDTIASVANKLGGAALGAARVAGLGTINPKVDVLYGNSDLRTFQFSFFMAPQSQKESQELKNIVKVLRKFSAPEITTPGFLQQYVPGGLFSSPSGQGSQLNSGLWFVPPAEFLISFHSVTNNNEVGFNAPENNYLPKIGRSVLTRIDVDYTQQGEFSTFADGSPTNLQLTMVFREMRIISQYDVDVGY